MSMVGNLAFAMIFVFGGFSIPATATDHGMDTVVTHIDEALRRYEAYGFSGGVAIAHSGKPLFSKLYGYASFEKQRRHTPDSLVDLGSVTKHITAAAILQLEEEGKLNTGQTLGAFFSGLGAAQSQITLMQLLNHTSGYEKDVSVDPDIFAYPSSMHALIKDTLPKSVPGAAFSYSNFGYCLLGRVIEKVSGQPFSHYLQNRLFEPAGLKSVTLYRPGIGGDISIGHNFNVGVDPYSYSAMPLWRCGPSGVMMTLNDVVKWVDQFHSGAVISSAAYSKMVLASGAAAEEDNPYALGLRVSKPLGKLAYWHDGDTSGHQTKLVYEPETETTVFIFSNQRDGWRQTITKMIVDHREGRRVLLPPEPLRKPPLMTAAESEDFAIVTENGQSEIVAKIQDAVLLLSDSELTITKAVELNAQAAAFIDAFRNDERKILADYIDGDPKKISDRLEKLKTFVDFPIAKMEVLGTTPWRKSVFQSHVRLTGETDQWTVVRLVWHPRSDNLWFIGSGEEHLLSRILVPTGDSSFAIFSPRDENYRRVSIEGNHIMVTLGKLD